MSTAASFATRQQDWATGTIEITGGHLAYHRTGGSGPVLVLSHGLTDTGLCWSRTAQALSADYDIVMLDARGHGESSRVTPGQAYEPALDLAEAIAALGLTAPIVMGHSVGASATAAFANAHPGLARRVILEDPPFLPPASPGEVQQRRAEFYRRIADLQALGDEAITALGRQSHPLWDAAEFQAWTQGKRRVDPAAMPLGLTPWQAMIEHISAPTLLLYGEAERGGLVTPGVAEEAMRCNPRIEAVRIEHAGHNLRRENFSGFLAAVRRFLGTGPDE